MPFLPNTLLPVNVRAPHNGRLVATAMGTGMVQVARFKGGSSCGLAGGGPDFVSGISAGQSTGKQSKRMLDPMSAFSALAPSSLAFKIYTRHSSSNYSLCVGASWWLHVDHSLA